MKLKSKLVLGNMLMVVLTMGSLSMSQWFISSYFSDEILEETADNISQSFTKHAQEQAEQSIAYLSEALLNPMFFYDIETIYAILEPALANESVLFIKVFDAEGLIVHTGAEVELAYGTKLGMPMVMESVLSEQIPFTQVLPSTLVIARPLTMNKTLIGGIVMSYSLKALQEDIEKNSAIIHDINGERRHYSAVFSLILTILMCLVSLFFSVIMAKTMTRPINTLLQHSKRISKGNYQIPNNIRRSDELGELAMAFDSMDSNLKQRNDEIEFLAYNDPLTKLPNRTMFIECLDRLTKQRAQSNEAFAVLFLDLDDFKRVNDNLGHSAGDELLCEVADVLKKSMRRWIQTNPDDAAQCVIARVGGDEFLLRLSQVRNVGMVAKFASDVVNTLKLPVYLSSVGESVVIGASIGVAMYPDSGQTPEALVKSADMAMYSVKEGGKGGCCFFNQEIEQKILAKGMIEKELRIAIEDFSQFQLYYQPKLDLKTKRIIGAEVLLRWCHPTKGYIPPSEFISVAESTELIHILGEWVVEQTCQNIQMWESAVELPSGFHVAINLSPKQLFGNKTLRVLSSQISKHKIDVARLHIEVTETALMFDKLSAKKTLDDLREMGIEVWLDDFGTGYSSLCFLREFNIDGLKIDRSFVNDIEHDTNDRALCAAIVTMAHQLGIKVIAEGIETPYHSDFLAQLNCDFGQGYLFAKPVPTEEMSNMLQNGIDGPLDS